MQDYTTVLKTIGQNFRLERLKRHLSQEQFAEYANVHVNYIGKIERGEQNLTIKKLVEIANSINAPLNEILYLADAREN